MKNNYCIVFATQKRNVKQMDYYNKYENKYIINNCKDFA